MKSNINLHCDRNIDTFAKDEDINFITKYLPAAVIAAWFFLLFYEAFSGFNFRSWYGKIRFPRFTLIGISPLFIIGGSFWYFVFSRFAYRIIFNFQEGKVRFHVLFKRKPIEHWISDIKIVNLTWHIYFKFNQGRTIWYAGNGGIFEFLSRKNIPRRWGKVFRRMNKKRFEADTTYKEPVS